MAPKRLRAAGRAQRVPLPPRSPPVIPGCSWGAFRQGISSAIPAQGGAGTGTVGATLPKFGGISCMTFECLFDLGFDRCRIGSWRVVTAFNVNKNDVLYWI